ncbi:hypothetical protein [Pseudomonas sp. PD9R]|uniref:hypothetical protein n=1 Tax=Pseudomonas sp. PD9R TaxID=2853534 RepID=UPI00210A92FE|nr:hypothetical protein [Pseudomonas sp. PD9R]
MPFLWAQLQPRAVLKRVVVVFDSDVPDFFLTRYDFVLPLTDTTNLPTLPDMLVRLSKAPASLHRHIG